MEMETQTDVAIDMKYRVREETISQILAGLQNAKRPLSRHRLMCIGETSYRDLTALLYNMSGHGLVTIDHRGVSITKKGKKALKIYRGLVDMISCE